MNTLSAIRANIFYSKEKGKMVRYKELIFLISETDYQHTSASEVAKVKKISQARFVMSDENMTAMIKMLETLRDAEEKDFV
jgi:uncharacterized tellurite resistance protein B-like protein